MRTLGERIRALRKERKMTLEACAGEQMTKGMLSLIENNKANPSMENLNYLAKRLQVDVSELWEEVSGSELRTLLDEAERLYKSENQEDYAKAVKMIEPILSKLSKGYESGRLLEIYGRLAFNLKHKNWQEPVEKASAIYDGLNIIPRRAAVGIFQALVLFTEHRYEESLEWLMRERAKVEEKSGYIDPLTKLDLDTYEAILRFAVNDTEAGTKVMNAAIEYSKKELIFYQTGQLYRVAAYRAVIDGDEEMLSHYERKIIQYGEFAEDKHAIWYTKIIRIHQLNSFHHDYAKAMSKLDTIEELPSEEEFFLNFVLLERGKALYGMRHYEEAWKLLGQVVISDDLHHPFDLSIYYEKDAYAALCAAELGDLNNAMKLINIAEANMSLMPQSPYTKFVKGTAKKLRNL
ncbi:helix-turn-helix domain-containing protein [Sporosarcina aquimarina]|uniref:Helix-turn-helix transcriptional regulator n=1 Tax=Sporosarcina aquimarina TaxID=114975 RepID=A0ABU4G1N1_9BACL|nr:helix-turn-helix transcriptional regulator [Sporosarcina aquimarina]MDW0110874.1 helix-turn-helix transcriptional regulator [Sporosarcina aquimarina]